MSLYCFSSFSLPLKPTTPLIHDPSTVLVWIGLLQTLEDSSLTLHRLLHFVIAMPFWTVFKICHACVTILLCCIMVFCLSLLIMLLFVLPFSFFPSLAKELEVWSKTSGVQILTQKMYQLCDFEQVTYFLLLLFLNLLIYKMEPINFIYYVGIWKN